MAPRFYRASDGTFPWQDGKPVLLTAEDFEDCCCPAPCSCPCPTWPPTTTTWPCNGLLQQYTLVDFFAETKRYDAPDCSGPANYWRQTRNSIEVPMNAFSGSSCRWQGATVSSYLQQRFYNFVTNTWGSWASFTANNPFVVLSSCKWQPNIGGFGFPKETGNSPAGYYEGWQSVCAGFPYSSIFVSLVIA